MADNVNHPPHYGEGVYEAIKVIEAWELGFCLGNAVKYICRAGKKHPDRVEDLRKAAWYLQREIEQLTSSLNAAVIEKEYKWSGGASDNTAPGFNSRPEAILNIPADMSPPPPPPRPPFREGARTPFAEGVLARLATIEREMTQKRTFGLGSLNDRIGLLEVNEIRNASRIADVETLIRPIVKWWKGYAEAAGFK